MFKPFLTKWPFLFKFRLFLTGLLLILVLFFLCLKIVPFGRISYSHKWPEGFRSGKGFIYDFKPAERMSADSSNSLRILADPVYFSLFTPRSFDKAKVTVRYRDHIDSDTPILEVGLLRDKVSGRYELKPLQNKILDRLLDSWRVLSDDNGNFILMSDQYYPEAKDFWKDFQSGNLKDCSAGPAACVALYNYRLDQATPSVDKATVSPLVIDQPWRGAHDFYVYLPGGSWHFDFDFVDLNQDKEADPISLRLYSGSKIIAEKSLADNNFNPVGAQTEAKSLSLSGLSLEPGIYKVSVGISDDMVIARIVSPSDRLSFVNKLWPVSSRGGLSLFTDIGHLQAKTYNPASLGNLYFGGQRFTIDKTYRSFVFPSAGGIQNIKLKSDDIILEGSGVFALSRSGLVNPALTEIDRYWRPIGKTKYIVADYRSPRSENGDQIATAEFDLSGAPRSEGRYAFLLSLPGLSGDLATSSYLEIKEIRIDLTGKNLWQKIISLFFR